MSNAINILPNTITKDKLPAVALRKPENKFNSKLRDLQKECKSSNNYELLKTAEKLIKQGTELNWSADYTVNSYSLDTGNNYSHIINFDTENIAGNFAENRNNKWKFKPDKAGLYFIAVNLMVKLEPFNADLQRVYEYWLNYQALTNEKYVFLSVHNAKNGNEIRRLSGHIIRVDDYLQPASNYLVSQFFLNGGSLFSFDGGEHIDVRFSAVGYDSPSPLYFIIKGDVSIIYMGVK